MNETPRPAWLSTLPPAIVEAMDYYQQALAQTCDPLRVLWAISGWRQGLGVELMRLAIKDARSNGATWREIGDVLGMSRQQAQREWGKRIKED